MTAIRDLFSLEGRIAIVTGGAGLYGRPMCAALAEAGAHVVVASRSKEAREDWADQLRSRGFQATALPLDLAAESSAAALCEEVVGRFGRIDVLVNGAVHRQGGDLARTSAADWDATSRINSLGLFSITKACAGQMADSGGGSIINIGSIYGVVGPDFSIYAGTEMSNPAYYAYDKGGMVNFTRYVACQYGPKGVRVNCISPGGLYSGQPEPFVRAYSARTPLGRMAGDDDIKGAVIFLASDASAYVTGINLMVDGGWTAH
jgi:NAD(P)-dependent dehydrogenase (short-subunit alcohol dehydrogenase family)